MWYNIYSTLLYNELLTVVSLQQFLLGVQKNLFFTPQSKHMFKSLNSCAVILLVIITVKWLISSEASELVNQILIQTLSLINNLLTQVQLP